MKCYQYIILAALYGVFYFICLFTRLQWEENRINGSYLVLDTQSAARLVNLTPLLLQCAYMMHTSERLSADRFK